MTSHIAKVIMEDFDIERAKADFVYFATHCLIDATTGKQFQWTPAQIEQLQKIARFKDRELVSVRHRKE